MQPIGSAARAASVQACKCASVQGILERLVAEVAHDFAARLHPAQPEPMRCISVAIVLHAAASTPARQHARPGRCAAASMHCAGLAVGTPPYAPRAPSEGLASVWCTVFVRQALVKLR